MIYTNTMAIYFITDFSCFLISLIYILEPSEVYQTIYYFPIYWWPCLLYTGIKRGYDRQWWYRWYRILKYKRESKKYVLGNCTSWMLICTVQWNFLNCKLQTRQEGIKGNYMYTKNQEDNATSTLMKIWRFWWRSEMWTPDYTAQY